MSGWAEIESVLEEERAVLLDGRIAELPALAERKVALLAALRGDAGPPERVRDLATRNAGLLEAAGRGIGAALHRIEEARRAGETNTYDAQGRVRRLTGVTRNRGTRV